MSTLTVSTPLTPDQIQETLTKHRTWLINSADGARADLYRANLSGCDLSGAKIYGHWMVETRRDLLWIGPLGSRNDFLMINLPTLRLQAGCFEGTIEAFLAAVSTTHGESEYGREYAATAAYLRALLAARKGAS